MNRARDESVRDADLVGRAQRGDASAFGELVARYQDRLFNMCYRMCRSHDDALDLAQSTFMKALQALPRFESRSNFYTWLFRIAMNLILSQRRRPAHLRLTRPDDDPEMAAGRQPAEQSADPRAIVARREQHERLARALARLEDEFRAAVVLKDIEDLDYAQIAAILEVPIGTVKSRIHRGRMMLREMLADLEDEGAVA